MSIQASSMASNKQDKATMSYVVDDLEGNFECCYDQYDSITDVMDEIASHLQGEYDDVDGMVGDVPTKRIKKIEIWINHDRSTSRQEDKPNLKWEIQDSVSLVAYADGPNELICGSINGGGCGNKGWKLESGAIQFGCECGNELPVECNNCGEEQGDDDMKDGVCIPCFEDRPEVKAYNKDIQLRLRDADIP
tara:strand:+ start:455 stop:1030 length:576 start_codon:yes stop_codon:yes gene_type:complete